MTHDVKAREVFGMMVKKVKGEEDEEEDEDKKEEKKDWSMILNCVILIVSKSDFNSIRESASPDAGSLLKKEWASDKSKTPLEHFFSQLKQWAGVDQEKILFHFCEM